MLAACWEGCRWFLPGLNLMESSRPGPPAATRPAGMAVAALATASVAVLVLALHTLQSLLMGGVFVAVGWMPRNLPLALTTLACMRSTPALANQQAAHSARR